VVGLDPRQHVRNVQVKVVPDYRPERLQPQIDAFLIVESFAMLLQLKVRVAKITIILDLKHWGFWSLANDPIKILIELVAQMIFLVLEKMLKRGWTVMVQIKGHSGGGSVNESEPIAVGKEDLNTARWYQHVKEYHKPSRYMLVDSDSD
jgi:hypothetical protein